MFQIGVPLTKQPIGIINGFDAMIMQEDEDRQRKAWDDEDEDEEEEEE